MAPAHANAAVSRLFVAPRCKRALQTALRALALCGWTLAGLGCGHPATKGECEEIFRRSAYVEVKAQGVESAEQVKERADGARAALGDGLIAACVGRRITDKAMQCVRAANTPEQLDDCLQ